MSIELKDDLPAMTPTTAKNVMMNYIAVCKAMLDPSDYAEIQGKKYKKRSAYRKLARAFGISDEIVKEEKEQIDEKNFMWRIHVKASSTIGRSAIGVGACSTRERNFAHVDHDVYAIAHTRAKNRAISDLLGAGEISAEEIEAPKTIEQVFAGRMDGTSKK